MKKLVVVLATWWGYNMSVEFGTPETWGMKVGQFLEEKEYTLPQPKPQDVIEKRRKDSLRKFLLD